MDSNQNQPDKIITIDFITDQKQIVSMLVETGMIESMMSNRPGMNCRALTLEIPNYTCMIIRDCNKAAPFTVIAVPFPDVPRENARKAFSLWIAKVYKVQNFVSSAADIGAICATTDNAANN